MKREEYESLFFSDCSNETRFRMEASPGYMGEAKAVARKLYECIPDAHIVFILRDPVERFVSSFFFHQSRFRIAKDVTIKEFVERCLEFEASGVLPSSERINHWSIRALGHGRYAESLVEFHQYFHKESVSVFFYDDLRTNVLRFMVCLCDEVGLDDAFFRQYQFHRENAGFGGRIGPLHRLAVKFNDALEAPLRRVPSLKRLMLRTYKFVNGKALGAQDRVPADVRESLQEYYAPWNAKLLCMNPDWQRIAWLHPRG